MKVISLVDIKFIPHIDGMGLVPEICPQPAKNFIPDWFKKMPTYADRPQIFEDMQDPSKHFGYSSKTKTAKKCPSFADVFNNGFVIPAPCDIYCTYDQEKQQWYAETGLKYSGRNALENFSIPISIHDTQQYLDHAPDAPYEYIFKLDNVWSVVTPKGYSIMQIPMLWHNNPKFEVAYGIIHTDQYHQINLQLMMRKGLQEMEIKMGTPLCYIVPYKREEYNLVLEPYDVAFHNAANLRNIGKFTNGYSSLFRRLNKKSK